jgi:hypothetical protein
MPKEQKTPIEKGPGSITPTFTPPSVSVALPGREQKAQPTRFERFRDAVLLAGESAALTAATEAQISRRLKAMKEKAVAEVERDQRLHAESAIRMQLQKATKERNDILIEGKDKSAGWTEQRLRAGLTNANSVEEQAIWMGAWERADALVKREDEEQEQMAFNTAARTSAQVISELQMQILEDPSLKAGLIGNGKDIGVRVQDYVLMEAMNASPSAFDLPENATPIQRDNRNRLIHQLMEGSFQISKRLVSEHNDQIDQANVLSGTNQIGSDLYSTLTGKQDITRFALQLDWAAERYFGSLAEPLRREAVKGTMQDAITKMASGGFGLDAISGIKDLDEVLNVRFEGRDLFTEVERTAIKAQAIDDSRDGFKSVLQGRIAQWKSQNQEEVRLEDGSFARRPGNNQMKQLVGSGADSEIYKIRDKLYREMNLNPNTDNADELALLTTLDAVVQNEVNKGEATVSKTEKQRVASKRWRAGARGMTGEDVVAGMDTTIATDPGSELTADELITLRADMITAATNAGITGVEMIGNWEGEPITEFTEETRPLWESLAMVEADRYNQGVTWNKHEPIPTAFIDRMENLFADGDQGAIEYATRVIDGLLPGRDGAFSEMLNNDTLDVGLRSAMNYISAVSRHGMANTVTLGPEKNRLTGKALVDMQRVAINATKVHQLGGRGAFFGTNSRRCGRTP